MGGRGVIHIRQHMKISRNHCKLVWAYFGHIKSYLKVYLKGSKNTRYKTHRVAPITIIHLFSVLSSKKCIKVKKFKKSEKKT